MRGLNLRRTIYRLVFNLLAWIAMQPGGDLFHV